MIISRPYKEPVSETKALEEIKSCEGSRFDPFLVDIFLKMMDHKSDNKLLKALKFVE